MRLHFKVNFIKLNRLMKQSLGQGIAQYSSLSDRIPGVRNNFLKGVPTVPVKDMRAVIQQGHKETANHWSSSEYNANNSWNVNFQSGNANNNNKYNSLTCRPFSAFENYEDKWQWEKYNIPDFMKHAISQAFYDCLRNKKTSKSAIRYLREVKCDLPLLAYEILSMTYTPSTSTCFIVDKPKKREIFAACFRDRIVHHLMAIELNPYFERRHCELGNVTYNCRKGYGQLKCIEDIKSAANLISLSYNKKCYYLKLDLRSFFMSIPKKRLNAVLQAFIDKKYTESIFRGILKYLVEVTVMHHPEKDCIFNSPSSKWEGLDPSKSLFTCVPEKGEPIGNLTTQLFANFYLSFLDEFILNLIREKGGLYFRFVDDFIILCTDKEFLKSIVKPIEKFLKDILDLELHPHKRSIQEIRKGINFIGKVIKPHRIYVSNRTIGNLFCKSHGYGKMIEGIHNSGKIPMIKQLRKILQSINSYLGIIKHSTNSRLKQRINEMIPEVFWEYFDWKGAFDYLKISNVKYGKPYAERIVALKVVKL